MLLTGIGVGLTLPTLMATGASSLPPHAFATGSAVVNMLRQVGLAIGVAVLIAVLGTPHTPTGTLVAYQRASWVTAAIAVFGGAVGLALLVPRPRHRRAESTGAEGISVAAPGEGLAAEAASSTT
jgi:MFS family permease